MAANHQLLPDRESGAQPDLIEARHFLDLLDPRGVFTFQTFTDRSRQGGKDPLAKVFHGTLDQHADQLTDINRKGAGIFVMVNEGDGVVHAGKYSCRTNANVIRIRAFFVDLDGAPLEPVRTASLHPHIIVTSSPQRWHAYWLVWDAELDKFSDVQRRLIAKFSSDPTVHDLCRVLRVPGFFHLKQEPFMPHVVFPKRDKP